MKRYNIRSGIAVVMEVSDDGGFVSHKEASEYIKKLEKELCEAMDFADEKIKFCMHLTEQNNKLQDENAELRELIYKCKSLMHARSSFEAYEIWEEVEEKLKEQGK